MKMGSSKRKSSFRIDDILHQRADHSLLYQHHAAATAAAAAAAVTAGRQSHTPGSQPAPDGVASLPYPTGPSYGAVPAHNLPVPVDCTAAGDGRIHRSSSPPGLGPPAHSAGGGSGSPASIGRSDSPKKPTAVYPGLLDFSKGVIPLPLQLGVPTFNPINAAYLEHYASVLHKATPRAVWPFYTHPYSYLLPPCGSKRKGGQVRFTPQQTQSLEKRFSNHKYLSPEDRRNLAIQLKLSDRQVKTWFQNRRAKWRRANNGCQSTDSLGPTPDSGLGGAGDPTKHPAHATAGYPSLTGCHTKKYPHADDDDDEDHASQGGHKDSRSARGVRTAPGYDCKSTDSFSDHEEDGSSDDPDEDDDEPASPINVI